MENEREDQLSRLLDDALATYASQRPRPGLELRVLNRIRAEDALPRLPLLRWAVPLATLACLLVGITLWRNRDPVVMHPAIVTKPAIPAPAIATITEHARP